MSDLTFEFDSNTPLETYEWDRYWIEHTENSTAPRVLYIGDSISCGTLPMANKVAAGKVLIDGYHTSKALDNTFYRPMIECVAAQEKHRELILLNNGLHGWHLDDEKEYFPLLRDTVAWLQKAFPNTTVAMVLTTHTERGAWQERAKWRGELAREVAEKMKLPVVDFYTLSAENRELLSGDGVHWQPAGYQKLATFMVKRICELLGI